MSVQPTIVSYAGDGSTKNFTFQFDYLNTDYVKVRVDGTDVPFTFTGTKAISVSTAPLPGETLVISRETNRDRLVDFTDGSVLIEDDLDLSALQVLHIVQEALDLAGTTLGLTEDGSLTAAGRRIGSTGDPIYPQDVVTKAWAETSATSQVQIATTKASEAASSAAAAAASETSAAASEANASTSEAAAAASAASAATAEANAVASADNAAGSAASAAVSAASAAVSETNAAEAEASAADSAASAAASAASLVSVPTGAVSWFAGSTAPSGFLICDGRAVSRTTYSTLFEVIGTTYGAGDDVTTFNIPDLRGEFVRGADLGRGVDPGRLLGTWQDHMLQDHKHRTIHMESWADFGSATTYGGRYAMGLTSPQVHSLTSEPWDGNHGSETRPRNVALVGIIRT